MANVKLPSLPPSDEASLQKNVYNGFYRLKTREFWGENEIIHETPEPFKKCKHKFAQDVSGPKCVHCHFGLIAQGIEVKDGALFYKGEKINF